SAHGGRRARLKLLRDEPVGLDVRGVDEVNPDGVGPAPGLAGATPFPCGPTGCRRRGGGSRPLERVFSYHTLVMTSSFELPGHPDHEIHDPACRVLRDSVPIPNTRPAGRLSRPRAEPTALDAAQPLCHDRPPARSADADGPGGRRKRSEDG